VSSNEQEWVFGGPDAEVEVLAEPRPGHTADEVARLLREAGASQVAVLSAGFVSARTSRVALAAVDGVATVSPKATKAMRRP
jgi:hypothetical protein